MKKEDLEYVSSKVTSETYRMLVEQAADRGLTIRQLIDVVLRAWLIAECEAGHVKDSPAAVAFMLRHGVGEKENML